MTHYGPALKIPPTHGCEVAGPGNKFRRHGVLVAQLQCTVMLSDLVRLRVFSDSGQYTKSPGPKCFVPTGNLNSFKTLLTASRSR
eukprot:2716711-Rhodomonas_salina.1